MEIQFKTIKKLLTQELEKHYESACMNCHHGVQRAFIHNGWYGKVKPMLEKAQTNDELEEVLSYMDYKMSLQEWIDSL